ncbi:hypothetical protein [Acidovorax sp.]|uniref:hypothetical protein n=1 Tax=Acidovorax sp. TaxID=1872122 RepID=UPI00262F5E25|nr:hypothetical protein [Acidovorax sp.]
MLRPPSPLSPFTAGPASRRAVAAGVLAAWSLAFAAFAAPAPWYYWRSKVDGARVCAQTSPGPGWERDSEAYEGPGCQPRRKVLIVPMR